MIFLVLVDFFGSEEPSEINLQVKFRVSFSFILLQKKVLSCRFSGGHAKNLPLCIINVQVKIPSSSPYTIVSYYNIMLLAISLFFYNENSHKKLRFINASFTRKPSINHDWWKLVLKRNFKATTFNKWTFRFFIEKLGIIEFSSGKRTILPVTR